MSAKYAYTIWQWGIADRETVIRACREISEVGYHYFETTRPFIDVYKENYNEFNELFEELDLKPVSIYFGLNGESFEEDLKSADALFPFMADNGIKQLTFQGKCRRDYKTTPQDTEYTLNALQTLSRMCTEYGIISSLHPHINTPIMYENEIDYIMQNTDPKHLHFGPDTAHLSCGGCDPVTVCERYKERIAFTHLKDNAGAIKAEEKFEQGREVYVNFCELGEGYIDFPGIFRVLKSVNYDGYLCVELDRSRYTDKKSAEISKKYLDANW